MTRALRGCLFLCLAFTGVTNGFFLNNIFSWFGDHTSTTTPTPFVLDPYADSQCPKHLVRNKHLMFNYENRKCYEFVIEQRRTWSFAKKDCESKGGNLVVIRNFQENTFVGFRDIALSQEHTAIWIGLSGSVSNGKLNYSWVTNEQTSYRQWNPSHRSHPHYFMSSGCAAFHNRDLTWVDENCYVSLPWICEYSTNALPPVSNVGTPTALPPVTTSTTEKATTSISKTATTPSTTTEHITTPTTKTTTKLVTTPSTSSATATTTEQVTTHVVTTMPAIIFGIDQSINETPPASQNGYLIIG